MWYILFLILAFVIIAQLILPFTVVVAARWWGKPMLLPPTPLPEKDFACIITAYKNGEIALPLVASLLRQKYKHFQVYLVTDECPTDFQPNIQHEQFSWIVPEQPLRLKIKSVMAAMARRVRPHDYVVIFDADNLAHPDFLFEVNRYAHAGGRCIQGLRTAKNTEGAIAAADSLGELYKNYIERYAPYLLGSSAVISGSGMATATDLYEAYLESPAIQQGQHLGKRMLQEDKILQNFLLFRNERIVFAREAICYDEKVQSAAAVETQRSRWLFSYFQNLPNTLRILGKGIAGVSRNQWLFGCVTLPLPMFLQVTMAGVLGLIALWVAPWMAALLLLAGVLFGSTVFWTLSLWGADGLGKKALRAIPTFMWRQMRALLKMFNPQKHFQHTEHTAAVHLEELIKDEPVKKP